MVRKSRGHKHVLDKAKQYEHAKKVACSAQIESAEKAAYAAQKTAEALEALEALKNTTKHARQTRRHRH